MNSITSTANPRIKALLKLRKRKFRDETGLILIEGVREVKHALEGKVEFEEVYYCQEYLKDLIGLEILRKATNCEVTLYKVSSLVFSKVSFGERKEAILAVAKKPEMPLEKLKQSCNSIFVVVEGLEKPGNLGAIMRTCDAADVDGLIVIEAKTDVYNPNVIRSSLGACFTLPIVEATREDTIRWLTSHKIRIVCAVPDAKMCYWQADLTFPCAIVLGSEDKGISEDFKQSSDSQIRIPMQGKVDSLNVSVASAIILYEALRKRDLRGR